MSTGKRAAEVMQSQLQPFTSNDSAASHSLTLAQSQTEALDLYSSADKKKQKLAKNRATAALSRERKKAHLDVLQQKVSLLEKTNIALSEQLALREAEVLQLKSRLDDVTETEVQESKSAQVPEEEKLIPPHIILPTVSALPRIFCSVAKPPSKSYPHQPNPTPTQSVSSQGTAAAQAPTAPRELPEQQQQVECKLEQSMSRDMPYQPVTIKPELQDLSRQGSQTQHAVITSGHFPVFSTSSIRSIPTCQPQPLSVTSHHQQLDSSSMCPQLQQQQQDQEQQHHGMMYTSDQLGGHLPPMEVCSAEHAATAYRSDAAGCLQKWQTSRYDIGDYMFGTTGNDYHLEADSSQFQNSLANDKTFTEQELMAWQLIPPEQMQSGMFSAQRGNMCFSASPGEPQCPDIGEASVMVCHQSGSSTPGIPDWEESKDGQQQDFKLDTAAAVHLSSWLPHDLGDG